MRTVPAPGGSLAETVDEQFLALICAEEELLRAEFDAIVADEWPGPPERPPHRREPNWQERRTPRRSARDAVRSARLPATRRRIRTTAWERSPPSRQ